MTTTPPAEVTATDFRNNIAEIFTNAKYGHPTTITNNGKPIAKVVHPDAGDGELLARAERAEAELARIDSDLTDADADATRWHDTYQQHAGAVDKFFAELLEMLPGAQDTGSDAYDQIPRGIEALRAERDRLKIAAQAALDKPHAARTVRMLCAALAASESHKDTPAPTTRTETP